MAEQAHFNVNRAWDANGDPSPGALAYFYESGTTTPLTTYSDEALTTPHASPVVADSEGTFPPVYVSGAVAVKVDVQDSGGTSLARYPMDPVILDGTANSGASTISFTPSGDNTATDVQAAIENNTTSIVGLQASIANPFTIVATAGSGNAFTFAAAETVTAYANGQEYLVRFDRAPTGAATLNIDSLGVKNIKKYDSTGSLADITVNDWTTGHIMKLAYDGTQFIAHGPFLADATTEGLVFFLDEDDLVSDRADAVSSQQAIKAYVDARAPNLATTQTTTSGTAFDFTDIPAGVNRIVVSFDGVSLSGSDNLLVQIGDAGGPEITGYESASFHSSGDVGGSTGFAIIRTGPSSVMSGSMIMTRMDGNRWVQQHAGTRTSALGAAGGGSKTLSAELTQVRITRDGTDTFSAGAVNISYEA